MLGEKEVAGREARIRETTHLGGGKEAQQQKDRRGKEINRKQQVEGRRRQVGSCWEGRNLNFSHLTLVEHEVMNWRLGLKVGRKGEVIHLHFHWYRYQSVG